MTSGELTFIFTSSFNSKAQNLNSLYRLLHVSFYACSGNLVLHQDGFPWLIIFFIPYTSYWFYKEKLDLDQV